MVPSGYQVSRIDLASGQVEPFFRTRSALGPEGQEYVLTGGPKHPIDVRLSRDGTTMYVVDIGAMTGYLADAGPFPRPFRRPPT
jgi:hypothetical protein